MNADDAGAPAAVRRLLADAGVGARRVRLVVDLLAEAPATVASLVAESAVDRRTVESVLAALGDDLVDAGAGRVRIAPQRVDAYRDLAAAGDERLRGAWRPYGHLLAGRGDLVERMREFIARAPAARPALDHVQATAETVALRALWLDATYELDGARVLCAGDHDLTSLALAEVNPRVEVTVVDVDDGVLAHIDAQDRGVRCVWADLRFGLPDSVRGWADLAVTDPPYTPEGVRLFLTRGLEGLRHHDQARLVMAYGFGEQPALGLKVQQAVIGLHLAYEAILPAFNRYHGAQAVGGASDLSILRPTSRSFRLSRPEGAPEPPRRSPKRSTVEDDLKVYTHGGQAVEGGATGELGQVGDAVLAAAAGPKDLPVVALVGPGWSSTMDSRVVALGDVLGGGEPAPVLGRPAGQTSAAIDLRADPGAWLVRVLLAVSVARLALLVPNNHPDLVDEPAQRALADLVGAKYRLRLRRSTPGPRLAIVEAERTQLDAPERARLAVRGVLDRAHGKVANTWREALIRADEATGGVLTRNEARTRIRTVLALRDRPASRPQPDPLDERLLALPRHRIAELVGDITASAAS